MLATALKQVGRGLKGGWTDALLVAPCVLGSSSEASRRPIPLSVRHCAVAQPATHLALDPAHRP